MKSVKYALMSAAVALLSVVVFAGDQPGHNTPPTPQGKVEALLPAKQKTDLKSMSDQQRQSKPVTGNYRISFKISAGGAQSAASVLVHEGVQGHYTADKELPVETSDKSGKKSAPVTKIVKCMATFLPVADVNHPGSVLVQAQFELSNSSNNETFVMLQLQTEFLAEKGKSVVLVDDSDKHIEVMVEDAL